MNLRSSMEPKTYLPVVVLVDCLAAVFAPFIDNWYVTKIAPDGPDIPLQAAAALIAVVTFTGTWLCHYGKKAADTTGVMRDAISAAVVVVYLVVLSWSAFFPRISSGSGELNPLTATFITNFTALTGVVVGFYFTTTAATQIAAYRNSLSDNKPPQQGATESDSPEQKSA